jgi:signal peptidase I
VAVILAMTAIGMWAVMSERISYVVTDGVSMNPVYYQGDLVFVVKADSYRIGQIVAYHGAQPGQKVLHRILGGDDRTGFAFKGDNNTSVDPLKPTGHKLIGRAVLHVPKGGIWLKPLLSPTGLGMIGFLIVSGGAAAARTRREIPRGRRKKKVNAMARQGGSWSTAMSAVKAVERLSPVLRTAAVLVAALTGFGIALAVLGWMGPIAERQSRVVGPGQTVTFSYSATVPSSAAYDGTTVTSPDPIFRKLISKVALHVGYQGHPGAISVSATLSDATGWHSTMLISPSKSFTGKTYDTTMNLDLAVFDKRARDAVTAIGGSPGPVSVGLKARVTARGKAAFTAPLSFTLAPLAFTLTDGASSLVVDSTTAAADSVVAARQIAVRGHPIMTASRARAYSVLVLLGSLVCAVGIALVARRGTPLRTRAEIERRHPQLLVHVEPMPSPPGKPVVTVDDFAALAKLAERYGQMVLTWTRPDADDFVVRDDGITYRYRIPLAADADVTAELVDVEAPARRRRGSKGDPAPTEDRPASHRYQ